MGVKTNKNIEIANTIIKNSLKNNKLSHAYLFELQENNNEIVFSFIKNILCPNEYSENCDLCPICNRINNNNYTGIKYIKPDGMWIKKEQLLELQKDYSKVGLESDKLIYVIYEAEKMNSSSANTLLKFLEEPSPGIIAILLTNNVHEVIDTIVSRCQVINCKSTVYDIDNLFELEKINEAVTFINELEKNKINILAKIDVLWNNILSEREKVRNLFEIIFLLYFNAMQKKLNLDSENDKYISNIVNNNTLYSIKEKLMIISDIREDLKFNVNIDMLMDKFIIMFNGVDSDEYSSNQTI